MEFQSKRYTINGREIVEKATNKLVYTAETFADALLLVARKEKATEYAKFIKENKDALNLLDEKLG